MLIFKSILIILTIYNILCALSYFIMLKAEKNNTYKEPIHKTMEKFNSDIVETFKLNTEIYLSRGVAHLFTLLLINMFSLTLAPAILFWLGIYLIAGLIRMSSDKVYAEEILQGILPPETIRTVINIYYLIIGFIACLFIGIGLVIWL